METDVTGFQSVRRGNRRSNDTNAQESPELAQTSQQQQWLDSEDPRAQRPLVDDGMDDIQRFRQRMKEQEVNVKGQAQVAASTPIQSTNIFDVLEQLESSSKEFDFIATGGNGKKSKFDKFFTESQQPPANTDPEYNKVLNMLANSMKISPPPQQEQQRKTRHANSNDDETDHLAALLASSIKGKKNSNTAASAAPVSLQITF